MIATGAVLLSFFLALASAGYSQQADQAYLPVAKAVIRVDGDKLETALQVLEGFARDRRATFRSGDFPKQGRRVANVLIRFSLDTFFVANSFLAEDELTFTAYSHEQISVWQPIWIALIEGLSERLGRENVIIVREPPNDGPKQ
jgi:hypothetical protein